MVQCVIGKREEQDICEESKSEKDSGKEMDGGGRSAADIT